MAFCAAAKHSFMMIMSNIVLFSFTGIVSTALIMLGKIGIMVGAGALTFGVVSGGSFGFTTDEYTAATTDDILLSSAIPPTVAAAVLAYTTASLFFYTYQMAIDTLLMCFIEEHALVKAAVESGRTVVHCGPASLIKFMEKNDPPAVGEGGAAGVEGKAGGKEGEKQQSKRQPAAGPKSPSSECATTFLSLPSLCFYSFSAFAVFLQCRLLLVFSAFRSPTKLL